ncbi:APC family permease [Phormidium sp. CCY1219]|uniref:APC family permease n=1 Tax=Phormidium sp. CCY1219 TaxID=2886104 RepID=UPI002D1EB052|nr:amino acid permease [Phormidium sp. CCY1219]MEB3831664.1 amino acid permease [Phormidium sp. CCY1219]
MKEQQTANPPAIGLLTAIAIVVANTIGTGVFTSLGFQTVDIKSGFSLLFLWFVGGIFALCGALCYGELGAAMPRSGGEYHFLSKIYHPAIGFLSGWVSITVGFAAPIAAAAMAFGQYSSSILSFIEPKAIAPIVVILISLIHMRNVKVGSYFQDSLTLLKVLLIVALIVCGFLLATPQEIGFLPSGEDLPLIFSAPFAISLVYVTYSYSGWNASIYLASEVKQPEKNIPRSLLLGTIIVMVLYLLLNFIFLYSTPIDKLAGELEVGAIAAAAIFGESGGKLMSFLIAFGLISSISSMVWAGPRVTQAIGEDISFFQPLAKKNSSGIPHYAILLQLGIVLVLTITSTFEAVIAFLGFTLTLSSFLTVLGVFVSRIKYPDIPRPYKTWGYPITPLIFLGISLWILVFLFMGKPQESLAGLAIIGLGFPLYLFASKKKRFSSDY